MHLQTLLSVNGPMQRTNVEKKIGKIVRTGHVQFSMHFRVATLATSPSQMHVFRQYAFTQFHAPLSSNQWFNYIMRMQRINSLISSYSRSKRLVGT